MYDFDAKLAEAVRILKAMVTNEANDANIVLSMDIKDLLDDTITTITIRRIGGN